MHFKDLTYVGVRTEKPPTDFSQFQRVMSKHLLDKTNRAARNPAIVFKTLKVCTFAHSMYCIDPLLKYDDLTHKDKKLSLNSLFLGFFLFDQWFIKLFEQS